jgi:hypothetical protein
VGGPGVVLYSLYIPDPVKKEAKETLRYFADLSLLSTTRADGTCRLKPSAFVGLYRLYNP